MDTLGHKQFILEPTLSKFICRQTARNQYDSAVTALLIYIHTHSPNINIQPDGG